MRRIDAGRAVLALSLLACAVGVQAAGLSVAYAPLDPAQGGGLIVDWPAAGANAHVTMWAGTGDGPSQVVDGARVVTLSPPIQLASSAFEFCGNEQVEADTLTKFEQVVVRPRHGSASRGTTDVVYIGEQVVTGGCNPGTYPFGSLDDPGTKSASIAMGLRPSLADLQPGVSLAGLAEAPWPDFASSGLLTQQVATFGTDSVTFADTGTTAPAAVADGWLVLSLPGFQRAYTRVAVDAATGMERWFVADWQDGAPRAVLALLMVKTSADAGFGTVAQASRQWLNGLFAQEPPQNYDDLYGDLTGAWLGRYRNGTVSYSVPVTWALDGANLTIDRQTGGGLQHRTWVPLANHGRTHAVMESARSLLPDGTWYDVILPRVNFYVDTGAAIEPAAAVHVAPRVEYGRGQQR